MATCTALFAQSNTAIWAKAGEDPNTSAPTSTPAADESRDRDLGMETPSVEAKKGCDGVAGRGDGVAGDRDFFAVGRSDADRHDRGAAAADRDLRAGEASAERAAAEKTHLEAGEGDPALRLADRAVPDRGQLVADLALDCVQEGRRVQEVDDDIEARAVEELVEAGEGLDALRFRDVRVVGRHAGRGGVGGALDEGCAGFAASGLGDRRGSGRERDGEEDSGGLHGRPPARSSATASQARCSAWRRAGIVTRRNNCACAIRSAAPEATIPGMRAAGTAELRPLWRSRNAISREGVSCERTFAVFETAGVRARWLAMLRRSPPFARPIASASASRALSMSSGGLVDGGKG